MEQIFHLLISLVINFSFFTHMSSNSKNEDVYALILYHVCHNTCISNNECTSLIFFNSCTIHIELSWYGGPEITCECYLLLSFIHVPCSFFDILVHQGWITQYADLQCRIVLHAKIFHAFAKTWKKSRYYFALPVVHL